MSLVSHVFYSSCHILSFFSLFGEKVMVKRGRKMSKGKWRMSRDERRGRGAG